MIWNAEQDDHGKRIHAFCEQAGITGENLDLGLRRALELMHAHGLVPEQAGPHLLCDEEDCWVAMEIMVGGTVEQTEALGDAFLDLILADDKLAQSVRIVPVVFRPGCDESNARRQDGDKTLRVAEVREEHRP